MNSLNLRQIDGGNVIKQADFGSNLSFELLDERRRKIPELDGQTATIRLIKGDNIAYQTESLIVDGTVSFKFDRVLEKGIYVLEIVAGNYVFPSNNMVKITIEKTAGNYKPENMVKTDLVELQGKITAIEQREHDVNQELLDVGQKQAEMTKRIEILESREDHDTIYNDTELKERLSNLENKESQYVSKFSGLELKDSDLESRVSTLEQKEDKDTVYDDSAIVKRVEALEQKTDNDTIYDDTEIKQSIANVDTKVDNLSEKVTALEERPIVDTVLTERVEALERKEDKDTVYDDTAIKERIGALEEKPDKDTIYDDSNLKSQIVELQTALNTLVRKRPPMSFYIDRSDMTRKIAVFDNGCMMINFTDAVYNYFYGYPGGHDGRGFHYYNLPGNLIKVAIGIVGIDSLKEEGISNAIYYCDNTKILNPIYDSSQFNFDELVIREPTDKIDYKLACQRNFVKIAYEIGALTEAEIIKLGATKK